MQEVLTKKQKKKQMYDLWKTDFEGWANNQRKNWVKKCEEMIERSREKWKKLNDEEANEKAREQHQSLDDEFRAIVGRQISFL